MSAKEPPVAYKPLTFKQIKAFAEKLRRNGLPPGTPFQFVRDRYCECELHQKCPVCTAERGESLPHDEEGE